MQTLRFTLPILLGLAAALASNAASAGGPSPAFDGKYRGTMTLAANGLTTAYASPACDNQRRAFMTVRGGYIYMSYRDWQRNRIHYRGHVDGSGQVRWTPETRQLVRVEPCP